MLRRGWFSGRAGGSRDRVAKALQRARDGDVDGAVEMVAERFPEALAALRAIGQPSDLTWLRVAGRIAFRAGELTEAAGYAEQAIAMEEDARTWHLLGR